jgi:hypothetical protein
MTMPSRNMHSAESKQVYTAEREHFMHAWLRGTFQKCMFLCHVQILIAL